MSTPPLAQRLLACCARPPATVEEPAAAQHAPLPTKGLPPASPAASGKQQAAAVEVQEEAWPARDDAIAASLPPGDTASFTAGTPAADPAPAAHASSEAAVDVAPYQTAEQDQQQQEGPVTEEQAEQAEELGGAAPAAPSPSAAASEGKASRASFQASRPQSRSRSRGGAASAATARGSRPSSGSLRAPSRGSLAPAPPAELAAALKDLSAKQPSNPISSLNAIRAAAMHSKEALELRAAVPLVVRATRAPRLGTMRAAILTLKDLFLSYGDALCAAAADDTSPTSSGVLALLQKATGTDLNSRRCADDANAALIAMVESCSPAAVIGMVQNHCMAKATAQVRAKAAAVAVAATYKQATTDLQSFDQEMTGALLRICEALLSGGGPACRAAARKLAVVCFSAFSNREAPAQGFEGEDPWAACLRLNVEPATAAALAEAVGAFGRTGAELVGAADLDGFALGHPMAEVIARLITASQ